MTMVTYNFMWMPFDQLSKYIRNGFSDCKTFNCTIYILYYMLTYHYHTRHIYLIPSNHHPSISLHQHLFAKTLWNKDKLAVASNFLIRGLKVLKVALMVRPWYFGTDRWSSPLYMTILLLRNWDSFGKQSWKKEKLSFTQRFLLIWLKFNGLSNIWLVFSNLTSLQFSWANAVTCNRQLPTKLDLFIFLFL